MREKTDNFELLVGRQNYINYTPCNKVLLGKLTVFQLIRKFPLFYSPRSFITVFTSSRELSLSSTISIQSMPSHFTSWRSILILFSHLRLGFQSGLFPSGFPTKILCTSFLSLLCVTFPSYHILHYFINRKIFGL